MSTRHAQWYSHRMGREMRAVRYGHYGTPVLLFPTAGGDAYEAERCGLIHSLGGLLAAGRIKVYSCDSAAGQVWVDGHSSGAHRAWVQNQFDAYVEWEMVPFIYGDCQHHDIGIITAGASFGAFNAVAALCRHPHAFTTAIGMSGTYDLSPWMNGDYNDDFHYCSPLHFLPHLRNESHLQRLRTRFVVLATGQGRWEDPGQSWNLAHVLGNRQIPNRVDLWSHHYDHDWPTWFEMLPLYLDNHA